MKIVRCIRKNRFMIAFLLIIVLLLIVIVGLFRVDNSTNLMIIEYMDELGWEIDHNPSEISHLTVPGKFDAVYRAYNDIQKTAGFDLEDFGGKKVTRYSYRVLNHKHSKDMAVFANIFVYENIIIAGDISSPDENGFIHSTGDVSFIEE